jgi:hypothetical protein
VRSGSERGKIFKDSKDPKKVDLVRGEPDTGLKAGCS